MGRRAVIESQQRFLVVMDLFGRLCELCTLGEILYAGVAYFTPDDIEDDHSNCPSAVMFRLEAATANLSSQGVLGGEPSFPGLSHRFFAAWPELTYYRARTLRKANMHGLPLWHDTNEASCASCGLFARHRCPWLSGLP